MINFDLFSNLLFFLLDMSFKKEMQKFNKLVLKFEKDSMRIFKKLEAMSISLDQKQEDYLGKFLNV